MVVVTQGCPVLEKHDLAVIWQLLPLNRNYQGDSQTHFSTRGNLYISLKAPVVMGVEFVHVTPPNWGEIYPKFGKHCDR